MTGSAIEDVLLGLEHAVAWGHAGPELADERWLLERVDAMSRPQRVRLEVARAHAWARVDERRAATAARWVIRAGRQALDPEDEARGWAALSYASASLAERRRAVGNALARVGAHVTPGHAEAHCAAVMLAARSRAMDGAGPSLAALRLHDAGLGLGWRVRAVTRCVYRSHVDGDGSAAACALDELRALVAGERGPLVDDAHALEGRILLAAGDRDGAYAALERSRPGPETSAALRVNWSSLAGLLGENDDAIAVLEGLDEDALDPVQLGLVRANLVLHNIRRGDIGAARRHARGLGTEIPLGRLAAVVIRGAVERVDAEGFALYERCIRSWAHDPDLPTVLRAAVDRFDDVPEPTALRVVSLYTDDCRQRGEDGAVDAIRARLGELAGRVPVPLGRFDLHEAIGGGAYGTVFRARDTRSGLDVAVKTLNDPAGGEALVREGRMVQRLSHPNIAQVLEVGTVPAFACWLAPGLPEGAGWVAMELVRDGTLLDHCGRLAWEEVNGVLLALLDALAHAHGSGVLHLDIKPENVLVEKRGHGWVPRLTDFGVSAVLSMAPGGKRRVGGTPLYMAPEQWSGKLYTLERRTDLYGLGCLAWELVTGRPLFDPDLTMVELGRLHCEPARPRLAAPIDVPEGLEDWLYALVALQPEDRFSSAREAAEALARLGPADVPASVDPAVVAADRRATEVSSRTFVAELDPYILEIASKHDGGASVRPFSLRPSHGASHLVAPLVAVERRDAGGIPGLERVQEGLWDALRTTERGGLARLVELVPDAGLTTRTLTGALVQMAREEGLVAHALDLGDPEWPARAVRAVVERNGLPSRSPAAALRHRFPQLPAMEDCIAWLEGRGTSLDAARALVRADLGIGPAVLVLRDAGEEAQQWRRELGLQCCLVVTDTPCSKVEQRLAVPRVTDADVRGLLESRLPLEPRLAEQIAEHAAGDVDRALKCTADLVGSGGLVLVGGRWALNRFSTVPPRPASHPAELARALLAGPGGRAATLAWLARRPQRDPKWAEARLLDEGQLPIDATRPAFAEWLAEQGDPGFWAEAERLATLARDRAVVLARRGRAPDALALLLDAAREERWAVDRAGMRRLLDQALDLADEHDLALPPEVPLLRALADPDEAPVALVQAVAHPETRAEALCLRVSLRLSAVPTADLEACLASGPSDDTRGEALALRADRMLDEGDAQGLRGLWDAWHGLDAPASLAPRRAWLWRTMRAAHGPRWFEALEDAVDDATDAGRDRLVHDLRACEGAWYALWGELDEAAAVLPELAGPGRAILELMLAIAAEDAPRVQRWVASQGLGGPGARAARVWLATSADARVWEERLAEPGQAWRAMPWVRWVLARAGDRLKGERREAFDAWLARSVDVDLGAFPGWAPP